MNSDFDPSVVADTLHGSRGPTPDPTGPRAPDADHDQHHTEKNGVFESRAPEGLPQGFLNPSGGSPGVEDEDPDLGGTFRGPDWIDQDSVEEAADFLGPALDENWAPPMLCQEPWISPPPRE